MTQPVQFATMTIQPLHVSVHTRVGSGHGAAVIIDGHAGTALASVSLVLTPGEARRIGWELMSAADRITTTQIGAS